LDLPFAPVGADRADGAPIRPARPAPEILLDRGHPADELPDSEALDTWTSLSAYALRQTPQWL